MNLEEMTNSLCRIGLTEPEAKVYHCLLELGGAYVSVIAKRASVNRTNCYHILKTLSEKGYISVTEKKNLKYYLPENPERILTDSTEKYLLAQKIVPNLLELQKSVGGKVPKIRSYDSKEGVRTVLNQILESKTTILNYTNLKSFKEKYFTILKDFWPKLVKRNLSFKIISNYHKDSENILKDILSEEYIASKIRLLFVNPREFYLENLVYIYDDNVSIISLNPGEHLAVVIKSQVYADTSRTIFNLSWLGASNFEVS